MQVEYSIQTIEIDEDYVTEMNKLKEAGWEQIPGFKPIAIFHLVRRIEEKPVPAVGGMGLGKLVIDDTKIDIVRDGKVVN